MKYKNTKTGAIIETSTKVSGKNWEPFTGKESEEKKTPSKNQGTEKDKSQEGTE